MAGRQQSDKQFTLHAGLLWVLRAHVEAYFKKHLEISTITNVKMTKVWVGVYIATHGYVVYSFLAVSGFFFFYQCLPCNTIRMVQKSFFSSFAEKGWLMKKTKEQAIFLYPKSPLTRVHTEYIKSYLFIITNQYLY